MTTHSITCDQPHNFENGSLVTIEIPEYPESNEALHEFLNKKSFKINVLGTKTFQLADVDLDHSVHNWFEDIQDFGDDIIGYCYTKEMLPVIFKAIPWQGDSIPEDLYPNHPHPFKPYLEIHLDAEKLKRGIDEEGRVKTTYLGINFLEKGDDIPFDEYEDLRNVNLMKDRLGFKWEEEEDYYRYAQDVPQAAMVATGFSGQGQPLDVRSLLKKTNLSAFCGEIVKIEVKNIDGSSNDVFDNLIKVTCERLDRNWEGGDKVFLSNVDLANLNNKEFQVRPHVVDFSSNIEQWQYDDDDDDDEDMDPEPVFHPLNEDAGRQSLIVKCTQNGEQIHHLLLLYVAA